MAEDTRRDDPSIANTDRLFRRVPPHQLIGEPGDLPRPSSAVFKNPELSVNIESLMIEQARAPEDTLTGYDGQFLCSIGAGQVREFGHSVVKDIEPPNDPAHGLVLGKKSGSFANAMVRACRWIVAPPTDR